MSRLRLVRPDFTVDRYEYRQPRVSPVERAFFVGTLVGAVVGAVVTWLLA